MSKKSAIFYTFLIGILLIVTLAFITTMTIIGAQNSDEFGSSLGGAIVFLLMIIVDVASLGLITLTSLISIIDYAIKKRVRIGVHIAFAIIYYLSVIAIGFFTLIVGLDMLINVPSLIVSIVLLLLIIIFTSINLKKGIEEAREY